MLNCRMFSRGGRVGNTYQVTQWFPKAAVYDRKGWHPMPTSTRGEFYSDLVITRCRSPFRRITRWPPPANYRMRRKKWQMERQPPQAGSCSQKQPGAKKPKQVVTAAPAPRENKDIGLPPDNVHDFAWFADKMFIVKTDTLRLPSGRVVNGNCLLLQENETNWPTASR